MSKMLSDAFWGMLLTSCTLCNIDIELSKCQKLGISNKRSYKNTFCIANISTNKTSYSIYLQAFQFE